MDEAALIKQAQGGEIDAYNTLVLHYQELAYNIAYRIVGEPDAAADATQEAFISAYRALGSFRGGSFKSWLLRIVTNACYDELRRRKRRPQAALEALYVEDESPEPGTSFTTEMENPETYAQRMDLQEAIMDCLQDLPEDQRAVTVMCDIEGFSYDEIADMAGVALGTVKSRLSRARSKLRDCLRGFGELLPAEYRLSDEM
ncbi:MAG TPA: sigma-70 family RNA polymerase sigma factor [Aggregatilineales bacterium]|nr:sigma-70 family RNA polymerase sigma factor [Aggregatilineales bacterium]